MCSRERRVCSASAKMDFRDLGSSSILWEILRIGDHTAGVRARGVRGSELFVPAARKHAMLSVTIAPRFFLSGLSVINQAQKAFGILTSGPWTALRKPTTPETTMPPANLLLTIWVLR